MANSLTIAGIHAAYGAVRVIDDVSLKVDGGETVALLGTNGNGKSTLMKCIMGIVQASQGTIVAEIDGVHHDLIGRTIPMMHFMRVDLPLPLVPSSTTVSPPCTFSDTSSMTRTAP